MILCIVNSPSYEFNHIRLKYFEPGHSFDAAHGPIETQIIGTGKLFDFRDIVEAVTAAKCEPDQMTHIDFMDWKSKVSQYALKQLGEKRPYLKKIVTATFCKGSEDITYQTGFDLPEVSVKVIKSNFSLADAYGKRRKNPRGVEIRKENKKELVSKLVP
ncbi:hypothetical protein RRG08_016425 [Elysia crispata]|uniref:Uncharacterized protein n=1 Tax=Elysia crispata TaxID=231223 RepID=A0AAE1CV56_9GAST|nr:hypothetical protein RRG08_016425 [Elysia crispata]